MSGLTPACVLCFGIVVADRIYEVEALPQGEGKFTAHAYRESGGGIAGTAAAAVAALGARALFCGAVGEDQAGQFLRSELAGLGIDLGGMRVMAGGRTPTASVVVDAQGERCLVVDRGTLLPRPPDPALVAQAGAVLVDHRFPEAAAALLQALPPHVPGVLDAEGGDAAGLRGLAAAATHPVFSRNGLQVATGMADPEQGLRAVHAPHAAAVGVTLGGRGSLWRLNGGIHHVPTPQVRVRDTTGCGDVFHGAFALALAEGMPVLEAARFASAAAALKARNGSGWHGMPDRPEAVALMRAAGDGEPLGLHAG
ncbi:MAG TPA: PfkB family carbohydrate kinase [Acetobacteraceae bacterium]